MRTFSYPVIAAAALFVSSSTLHAYERLQGPTEVLYWNKTHAYAGYTFFGVRSNTYLINMEGRVLHTWPLGTNPRLLTDGNLLDATSGDVNGFTTLREVDWNGNTVWQYTESRTNYAPHHDFIRIFNPKLGTNTTLYIAAKSVSSNACIAAGCNPANGPYTNAQVFYRTMIDHVKKVLADIKRVVPDYDSNQGYEIAGFVWLQAWNDWCDSWWYPAEWGDKRFDEYGQLMAMFIRDVRKDLSAPKMPFVIGVAGFEGVNAPPHTQSFRKAMAAPTLLPEFKSNVVAVQTAPFWDDELAALQKRMEASWPKVDARVKAEKDESWENKMKAMAENFTPEEWKRLQRGASNAGYHYLGCAKTFALMGKAFAEAVVDLQKAGREDKQ